MMQVARESKSCNTADIKLQRYRPQRTACEPLRGPPRSVHRQEETNRRSVLLDANRSRQGSMRS
jgi:hypothetical protein